MPKGDGPNSGTDYTGLSSFGVDADGEIYFCQMSSIGGLHFSPWPAVDRRRQAIPFPKLLSQTGVFRDPVQLNTAEPEPGPLQRQYAAVVGRRGQDPLAGAAGWRDRVHFAPNGEWTFPPAPCFVKNFETARG